MCFSLFPPDGSKHVELSVKFMSHFLWNWCVGVLKTREQFSSSFVVYTRNGLKDGSHS